MKANHLSNVTCEQIAVCNANGSTLFAEFEIDPTGQNPWMPEASTLMTAITVDRPNTNRYDVRTVRLDDYFAEFSKLLHLIKIDVEGFEVEVLKGAQAIIRKHRPFFSIDIHKHPTADGNTEAEVKAILEDCGYRFERLGHVLAASPN